MFGMTINAPNCAVLWCLHACTHLCMSTRIHTPPSACTVVPSPPHRRPQPHYGCPGRHISYCICCPGTGGLILCATPGQEGRMHSDVWKFIDSHTYVYVDMLWSNAWESPESYMCICRHAFVQCLGFQGITHTRVQVDMLWFNAQVALQLLGRCAGG